MLGRPMRPVVAARQEMQQRHVVAYSSKEMDRSSGEGRRRYVDGCECDSSCSVERTLELRISVTASPVSTRIGCSICRD